MRVHSAFRALLLTSASLFICYSLYGQGYQVVSNSKSVTSYEGKSYYISGVAGEVKLLPGFQADSLTPFFCRQSVVTTQPPTGDKAYMRTYSPLVSGIVQESQLSSLPVEQRSTTYQYVDGLGRSAQTVVVQGSPLKNDVVTFQVYDNFGMQPKEYLPFTVSSGYRGQFLSDPVDAQALFYSAPSTGIAGAAVPYKQNFFESSPLNRVFQTLAPHEDAANTQTLPRQSAYTTFNTAGEVTFWKEFTSGVPEILGTHATSVLTVEQVTNEEGKVTKSYKNGLGQVVMSRAGKEGAWFDVHYIYNPIGQLMFVIQPEGASRLAEYTGTSTEKQAFLDRWAFQYQYDAEGRVIAKRIPGYVEGSAGWEYTVYDQWDRVVLTQSPDQRTRNEYSFNKYDRFNRLIMTGVYVTTTPLATLRTSAGSSTAARFETETNSITGYTLTATFPVVAETDLLTVSYYDNYAFMGYTNWDAQGNSFSFVNIPGYPQNTELLTSVKGYQTGSKTRLLDQTNKWLNAVTHYDKKYRPVQVIAENHLGGVMRSTSLYNFTGKAIQEQLYNSNAALTITKRYEYDHALRPLKVYHKINAQPEVLMVAYGYNELGQLIEKNVHSTDGGNTFLQSIDQRYNIKGWLTHINNSSLTVDGNNNDANDLFGMELVYYSNNLPPVTTPNFTARSLYDGNISFIRWKTDTRQGTAPVEKIYAFDYDVLSRMKEAVYATNAGTTAVPAWTGNQGMFDERILGYDKNGNISGLTRQGNVQDVKTIIDNLSYTYKVGSSGKETNRLIAIDDAGNSLGFKPAAASITEEYEYDNNGRLKKDHNKQISSITYNHLNLVKKIQFTTPTAKEIEYVYDATGVKVSTIVKINNSEVWKTDYAGGLQYDNGQFSFLETGEGRAMNNNGMFDYQYFLRDHQDNVRLVYGSLKETLSYRATMESPGSVSAREEADFKNIAATRFTGSSVNYTKSSNQVLIPDKAAQCNGFIAGKAVGPAKSLRVLTGDKVYMETFATLNQIAIGSTNVAATTLLSAMTTPFGIVNSGETATLYQSFNTSLPGISSGVSVDIALPKAYLVWIFFNDSYVYVNSGAQAITYSAFNAFEKLSRSFTASQNGYLYIYVVNESNVNSATNVYFDETYILHEKNNTALQVIQASDYYPFGLSYNEFNLDRLKETSAGVYATELRNRYKFQGQEEQRDLDLGWYQYKWRMHDPAIGRFGAVDPLSEKYDYNSVYAFSENQVVNNVELEGQEQVPLNEIWDVDYVGVHDIGKLSPWFFKSAINNVPFEFYQIEDGVNKGNFYGRAYLGTDEQGVRQNHWKYVVGANRIDELKNKSVEDIDVGGVAYNWYGFASLAGSFKYMDYRNPSLQGFDFKSYLKDQWTDPEKYIHAASLWTSTLRSVTSVTMRNPHSLTPTHGLTLSKSRYNLLKSDIKANGIKEPIKFVRVDNTRYVVDGHHRLNVAKELRLNAVPTTEVSLPYAGYKTLMDLIFE